MAEGLLHVSGKNITESLEIRHEDDCVSFQGYVVASSDIPGKGSRSSLRKCTFL